MDQAIKIQHFFHKNTCTLSYPVWDEASKDALVIDRMERLRSFMPTAERNVETRPLN